MYKRQIYESIVKGRHQLDTGLPESFKVLISELKSLCLNIELLQKADEDEEGEEDLKDADSTSISATDSKTESVEKTEEVDEIAVTA